METLRRRGLRPHLHPSLRSGSQRTFVLFHPSLRSGKKRHLFWDVAEVDPKKYPKFVIERILEYGDEETVRWMLKNFNRSQIKEVLSKRRGLSSRSANYWSLVFNVPKNKILCLNRSYQKMRKTHWPY